MGNLEQIHPAISKLEQARYTIADALGRMMTAAQLVKDTPEDDRIMSLSTDLENLHAAIQSQIDRMKGLAEG